MNSSLSSIGTLTSLNVSGNATMSENLTLSKENGTVLNIIANASIGGNIDIGGNVNVTGTINANNGIALSGGNLVISGNMKITGLGTPTSDGDATNKLYVDNVAQGLDSKPSVKSSTTAALPDVTYDNGSSGVAATLTGDSNGALADQDDISLIVGDRILVKNQVSALQNGIYVVTQLGDGSSPFILTRTSDFDEITDMPGAYVFVEEGTTNANIGYVCLSVSTDTVGTSDIDWTQFSGAGQILGGTGITKVGYTLNADANQVQVTQVGTLIDLTVDGAITGNSLANISDTLSLTKSSGVGLYVTSNANIGGNLTLGGSILDSNGNNMVSFLSASDAVNYIEFSNAESASDPGVSAIGEDVNIDLNLFAKGSGKINMTTNTNRTVAFDIDGASASNTLTLISNHSDDRILTFPDTTDVLIARNTIDTLTNKTLTSPIIDGSLTVNSNVSITGDTGTETTLSVRANTTQSADILDISQGNGQSVLSVASNGVTNAISANIVGINGSTVPLTVTANTTQSADIFNVELGNSTDVFTVNSSGITTVLNAVLTTADINGGTLDNVTIGASTPSEGTFTVITANDQLVVNAGTRLLGDDGTEVTLLVRGNTTQSNSIFKVEDGDTANKFIVYANGVSWADEFQADTADINGGTLDNVTIGASTPSEGTFTVITANDQLVVNANASIIGDSGTETTLSVTANTTQSADILDISQGNGQSVLSVASNGVTNAISANIVGINGSTVPLTVTANTTQSADIFNVELGNSTDVFTVNSSGITTALNAVLTTADINGGTLDNVTIGASTPSEGTFTVITANDQLVVNANASIIGDTGTETTLLVRANTTQSADIFNVELGNSTDVFTVNGSGITTALNAVLTTADINGGTLDNVTIGSSTPSSAVFTNLTANDNLTVNANVSIIGDTDTETTLYVRANTTQSANILDISQGDGTSVLSVASNGVTTISDAVLTNLTLDDLTVNGNMVVTSDTPTATGSGFDAVSPSVRISNINGEIVTTILVDIGAGSIVSSAATNKFIGEALSNNAYLTKLSSDKNGYIYRATMACIEAPATGDAEIDLYLAINNPSTGGDAIGELQVIDSGESWVLGKHVDSGSFTITVGAKDYYVGLAHVNISDNTYTSGKFIIKLYGANF